MGMDGVEWGFIAFGLGGVCEACDVEGPDACIARKGLMQQHHGCYTGSVQSAYMYTHTCIMLFFTTRRSC